MFSPQTHRLIYIAGLCGLAFGMMVGTVPTSVPQIALMGNWLLEGRFRKKWASLRSNPLFWTLSSVFLIHLAGLLYTEDLSAGGDDVRTKMPLMFLPMLIFSSGALTRRELRLVLFFFILGCVASTAWSLLYTYLLHPGEGLRNASRFMSHIRLGLFLNMGIATCVWFMRGERRTGVLFLFAACACYFFACMYLLGLFSGLLNFFLLLSVACLVLLYRKKAGTGSRHCSLFFPWSPFPCCICATQRAIS